MHTEGRHSDELFRIFGPQDQVFAAPSRSLLMSFPLATPTRVIADAIVEMEAAAPWPLMLDPFLLSRGELTWQPGDDLDDDARGRGD